MRRPQVRLRPRVASAREVEVANQRLAERGRRSRIDPDVEAVVAEVAACEKATPSMLRVWAQHPDERVPLALLDNPVQPWLPDYERYLQVALTYRCIADLEAGLAWTPLLDRVQRTDRGFTWTAGPEIEDYAGDEGLAPLANPFRSFSPGTDRIGEYLAATDDRRFGFALARSFSHWTVQRTAGEHAPVLTDNEIEAVLDRAGARRYFLAAYVERADVPHAQVRRLARWTTARVRDGAANGAEFLGTAGWVMGTLGKRTDVLDDGWVDALLDAAAGAEDVFRHRVLTQLFIVCVPMTADQARRAWSLGQNDGRELARHAAEHPDVPVDVLEAIAETYTRARVREALASRLKDLPSATLTAALARSTAMDVVASVLAFGTGPGAVKVLRRSDAQDVGRAILRLQRVLAEATEAVEDSPSVPASFDDAVRCLAHHTRRREADLRARMNAPIGWAEGLFEGRPEDVLLLLRLAWHGTLTAEERSRLLTSTDDAVRLFAIAELGGPRPPAGRTR